MGSIPTVDAGGGRVSVSLTAQPDCAWDASTTVSWISGLSPTSGRGNGAVAFTVAPNDSSASRDGAIVVNGTQVTVSQRSTCAITLAPPSQNIGQTGGTGSVTVSAASGCTWTATTDASWITLTGAASGNGNGTVSFSVAANSSEPRTGNLIVAGVRASVNQASISAPPPTPPPPTPPPPTPPPASGCTSSIEPSSQSVNAAASTGTVAVTTGGGCAWTAASNAPWITIASGATGTGNGSVGFSVAANTGAERSGTATIATQTCTVTQAAVAAPSPSTYSISPTAATVVAAASTGTVAVTAGGGCAWTAASNAPWITITSGATGTGNGNVGFSVAANTGAARNGTATIASQTFTVTQAAGAASCAYALDPTGANIGPDAGQGPINVITGDGCPWTATTNVPWISVASGSPGTGNGRVLITFTANSGPERTGIVSIATGTFTLTQRAGPPCTFSLSPTSQSVGPGATTGSVSVTTVGEGCTWNPFSSAPWLRIVSPGFGDGSGVIQFSVEANFGPERTATITVRGQVFTLTQAATVAPSCTYAISPTSQTVPAAGGSGSVSVTTASGCAWTASSRDSWITVTSGASGTGNGSVAFSVAANPGGTRDGTLSIGGQTFSVTQPPVSAPSPPP